MIAFLTALSTAAFFLGAYATFHTRYRDSEWYAGTMLAIGALVNLLFALSCKRLTSDPDRIFYSLIIDVIALVMYAAVPVFFFGVRLTPASIIGFLIIVAGFVVFKLGE